MASPIKIISGKLETQASDGRKLIVSQKANGTFGVSAEASPEEIAALTGAAESSGMSTPTPQAAMSAGGVFGGGNTQTAAAYPRENLAAPVTQAQAPLEQQAPPVAAAPNLKVETETIGGKRIAKKDMQSLEDAGNQQKTGIEAVASAEVDAANKMQAERETFQQAQDSLIEAEATREQQRQQAIDTKMAGFEQSIQEMRDFNFDPGRFMANQDTLGKISAAVAIGLGAVGAAMTGGKNEPLAIVQAAIDRDIDSQKAKFEQLKGVVGAKKTLFDTYMNVFQDQRAAGLAAKTAMLESYKHKLEIAANSTSSAKVVAAAQLQLGAVSEAIANNKIKLLQTTQDTQNTKSQEIAASPAEHLKLVGELRTQLNQEKQVQAHLVDKKTLSQIDGFIKAGLPGVATIKFVAQALQQGSFGSEMQNIVQRYGVGTITDEAISRLLGSGQGQAFMAEVANSLRDQIGVNERNLAPVLQTFDQQARSLGMRLENLVGKGFDNAPKTGGAVGHKRVSKEVGPLRDLGIDRSIKR